MVRALRQRKDAVATDPAPSWLEPGYAVGCARKSNRSPGVAPQRTETQTGCGGDSRPTRRGSRVVVRIPGIAGRRDLWMMADECALCVLELAQQHRPRMT